MTLSVVPTESSAPTKRAVIYLRVSTKEQAQRDGDPEGYSIPAQRAACLKKAEALGAKVVAEFVDRGESARSADRAELQQMLKGLLREPADFVIVHKVDRLARNRYDDAVITAQITASGAQLVSVSENIDETPSGLLLHGIMSSIAEFYSRNLANEVIKGTQQKVSSGGTPHVAPIGYLNVHKSVDGHDVRTVDLDPERAEHVRWAFEAYASGDWSLHNLAVALEARGLSQRATPKRAARPLPANKLHELLRNRYYRGFVTWSGVEHQGKHEPLVSAEVFEAVQHMLVARRQSGERSYRHKHYLAGSVFCARCGARLLYGVSRGARGDAYAYFFCAGRHSRRNGCELPYLAAGMVEQAVARQWAVEMIPEATAGLVQRELLDEVGIQAGEMERERSRLRHQIDRLRRERYKWADMVMNGAVPPDIAAEKQGQLGEQLLAAEAARERLSANRVDYESVIKSVFELLPVCEGAYATASDGVRRDFNQAWFEGLFVDVDEDQTARVDRVQRTPLLGVAHRAREDLESRLDYAVDQEQRRRRGSGHGGVICVVSSNYEVVVGVTGFEPATSASRTQRATKLRHTPVGYAQQPTGREPAGAGWLPGGTAAGPAPTGSRPGRRSRAATPGRTGTARGPGPGRGRSW
jgi:site-specific DNA recombinase